MKVSIVIPTLNAGPLFKEVLEAVRGQEFPGQVELLIVDSMSGDGTAELGRKYADIFLQVERSEFNHGETRNLAVAKAGGELVALLVQDATPADKHWLKKLADNFSDPRVAGAYSRQIPRPDCNPLLKSRLELWGAGQKLKKVQELKAAGEMNPRQIVESYSFDNVSSMIRRPVWERIPFRRRKFAEDILWAKEVLEAGWKIVFEPASMVVHSHNKSLWYEFRRVYLDHQNWWQVGNFRVFNRPSEVVGASIAALPGTLRGLRSMGLSGFDFLYWSLYAPFYLASQNLAQFMGGWSDRWKVKYSWYDKIDSYLSRGV
jgi:rhamnosyltransferase